MKKLTYSLGWIAVLVFALSAQARADMIVNTGTPTPLALNDSQWLATKFTTTQDWQIASLQGFINADDNNPDNATYTVALYANGSNKPDTNNELFSQEAILTGNGWNGLQGLNFALSQGTYWLAFEVRSGETLQGLMSVFAPSSLQTAYNDNTGNLGYKLTSGTVGVQISSVPVPSALWLFATGLFAVGGRRLGKRQA